MFSCLFSESSDSQETKKLKYRYNTTKTLEMARVFLVKKDSAEKEEEEVGEKKIIFLINKIFKAWYANRTSNLKVVSHFFSTIFQLIDNQFAPKKWQFPVTKYINFCMHVALTYGSGSGIGRWVWRDIRAEVIAFLNQFYFLTSWTNIVWKWIWNKEKQTRDYQIGSIHLQHTCMPIAVSPTGQICWLFVYVIVNLKLIHSIIG